MLKYYDISIPAPKRLAMMRAAFDGHAAKYPHCPEHVKPKSWRDIRGWSLGSYEAAFCTLSSGAAGEWYSHAGPEFRNERDAGDIVKRLGGHYTDVDCHETAVGIVARLTHGRFIAGYRWASNGERVYFSDVFTNEDDAARTADEHARIFAESARDDDERFNDMQNADDALETLRGVWALRRTGRRDSDDVREAIEALRNARETLKQATAVYENGGK
jgi:hypothetical protein